MTAFESTPPTEKLELPQKRIDLFWSKVNKDGPVPPHMPHLGQCWMWTGRLDKWGYGITKHGKNPSGRKREFSTHRFSYAINVRRILPKECVLHHCDTPACVNPAHLFTGSHRTNSDDKVSKGRHLTEKALATYGCGSPKAKFTEEQIREIRAAYTPRLGWLTTTAIRYGVERDTISAIVRKITYRNIL